MDYDLYQDDEQGKHVAPDCDDLPDDSYQYIGTEVALQNGDEVAAARVKRRKLDGFGNAVGRANQSLILDTRLYTVEFPDGAKAECSANVITENIWAQCDIDGNQFQLLDVIIDHRKDGHAVQSANGFVTVNGRKHMRKTTQGWHLSIQWKDGSTSWERLTDVKESNPVEAAEYAITKSIESEPAFTWWVDFMMKKRDRIIAAVNQRVKKKIHKFGVRVPKNIAEAHALDAANGDTLWADAIHKEMTNVKVVFKVLVSGKRVPVGHQEIRCHGIFDVKMDSFAGSWRPHDGGSSGTHLCKRGVKGECPLHTNDGGTQRPGGKGGWHP
jgi:hypothetical protein